MRPEIISRIERFFDYDPASSANEISLARLDLLSDIMDEHFKLDLEAAKLESLLRRSVSSQDGLASIPFIPARLFKSHRFRSAPDEDIIYEIHSSGTSTAQPSRAGLDRGSALRQERALSRILSKIIDLRAPMLLISRAESGRDFGVHVASAAAIRGVSRYSRDRSHFILSGGANAKEAFQKFLEKARDGGGCIFGFTPDVWDFAQTLPSSLFASVEKITVLHGGGWKRLENRKVSRSEFRQACQANLGASAVYDYYGMAEQVGSIFLECSAGWFHPSIFSDVLIRDARSLLPKQGGEPGVLQVFSVLPTSYIGNSILTDDTGRLVHPSDCPCGQESPSFEVLGRLPRSEIRGCGNV